MTIRICAGDRPDSDVRSVGGNGTRHLRRGLHSAPPARFLRVREDISLECIDSNFVSSVGEKVNEFEQRIAAFTGAAHAVATVNGTAALHVALQLAGVQRGDEVLTQALTFVATCNAVSYLSARPVFLDVDRDTLGLSPEAVERFLTRETVQRDGCCFNRKTGARIAACVPMHTFGFPCRIGEIIAVCDAFGVPVVEDAAESLGSFVGGRHTGTFGRMGTLSFNGNKIITTGGGGMLLTDDADLARKAKHLTTTAKLPHAYEFVHDEIGYNYRLPNLNAALGCAQMERLPDMLSAKRAVADRYAAFVMRASGSGSGARGHAGELLAQRAGAGFPRRA
jgi:perosamine synthetase